MLELMYRPTESASGRHTDRQTYGHRLTNRQMWTNIWSDIQTNEQTGIIEKLLDLKKNYHANTANTHSKFSDKPKIFHTIIFLIKILIIKAAPPKFHV